MLPFDSIMIPFVLCALGSRSQSSSTPISSPASQEASSNRVLTPSTQPQQYSYRTVQLQANAGLF